MGLAATDESYAFATFQLYPKQRKLLRGGEPVDIRGRAFDVLLLLVSRAGFVVSRTELMDFVWPGITVEEANLRVQMAILRKVLSQCDEAGAAINTIPLRGYCFVLPVQHQAGRAEIESRAPEICAPLPALLNPIFGREDAIRTIIKALDERRLVTITGPGGIGKSTVAVAAAHSYAANYDGVMTVIDLSHVTDGAGATAAIAAALKVDITDHPLLALCEYLQEREMLLILDTCEHIVEPIAALVELLLSHCPKLRLLVTSREALRATGEWTHRLPSLAFPEDGEDIDDANIEAYSAVTMFVDRVRSSMRFEITNLELPMLAEICRRLDGIPLALEFAAARVADLGLSTIATHLDDCFAILTRGRRTALPRHRTLSATLDWGYSLLSHDEQRMLRHLTTLGRSFTAEHAIAAGSDAGCERPPEALASLYEKSLIFVDMRQGAPVYRLLDTTRTYVANINVD